MSHSFIPEDIIVNILLNLPVDSLTRFKCVCKQWCRLISETNTKRRKVLVKSVGYGLSYSFQLIDQTTRSVESVKLPWEGNKVRLYGSCNGLLLIGHVDDLFLWNPYSDHRKKLFSYKGLTYSWGRDDGGLCFDLINKEYKVVMYLAHDAGGENFAMVGSSINKTWKHVDFPYPSYGLSSGPVVNNHLHWSASNSRTIYHPHLIIYFDTRIDGFVELPIPPPLKGERDVIFGLGVLDGCLCMSRSKRQRTGTVQILTMKMHGVRESWNVLFKMEGDCFQYCLLPVFYCDEKKHEVLMNIRELEASTIISYDISANSRSDLISSLYFEYVTAYEETLVTPAGYDWEELEASGESYYVEKFLSNYQRTMKRDEDGQWYVYKEEGCRKIQESEESDDDDF